MLLTIARHTTLRTSYGADLILYVMSIICVPLFVMVSGYLLFGKENASYWYSFKKITSIIKYVVLTVGIWFFANLFIPFQHRHELDYTSLSSWLVNLDAAISSGDFLIYWYFKALIVIYAIFPILNRIYNLQPNKFLLLTAIVVSLCQVNNFTSNFFGYPLSICRYIPFFECIMYFLIGGVIKRGFLVKLSSKTLLTLFCVATGIVYGMYFIPFLTGWHSLSLQSYWTKSFSVVTMCITFFILSLRLPLCRYPLITRIVSYLSPLFLPIFSFHFLIRNQINGFDFVYFSPMSLFLIVTILATIAAKILYWNPRIKNVFSI